jgi:hypothetical protein
LQSSLRLAVVSSVGEVLRAAEMPMMTGQ